MLQAVIKEKSSAMIDFKRISPEDKQTYEKFFPDDNIRGCEFSFANLYLWGRQSFAVLDGQVVLFSQFNRKSVYPFPVGKGDKKAALDAVIADSRERGIPCRITGLDAAAKEIICALYPDMFRFHCDEGSFDYVYDINDLAELKGKKYHGKKNHFNRFRQDYPHYTVEPISESNISDVRLMVEEWYRKKLEENPHGDYYMEQVALDKAFKSFRELAMDGLVLRNEGQILAMTLGSLLSEDTFDVQFEKARADVNGAYAAINCEFARYIRSKYPNVKFLDREEDMGLEGLRRAKQSYRPHHMVEKCWACLLEDGYEY